MAKKSSKWIYILLAILVTAGSLMIVSAEMGDFAGDTSKLTSAIVKQLVIIAVSAFVYFLIIRCRFLNFRIITYQIFAALMVVLLFVPLFFNARNGAHAWIGNGSYSFQPSELAKVFSIALCARLFRSNQKYDAVKLYKYYACYEALLIGIVLFVQNDMGTAIILCAIVFCMLYVVYYKNKTLKNIHNGMSIFLLAVIAGIIVLMLSATNNFLREHSSDYRILRVVSSQNPFIDQYSSGYHLVMSLTAMASGGLFGTGYGESIHKFMNFPNPSSDFIVAVIIEEIGFLGFAFIAAIYLGIMAILILNAFKTEEMKYKVLYLGTFVYFFMHFVLNIGGVSSLIPLTGVPLLIISSGGSSTLCAFIALGLCQSELSRGKK